MATGPGPEGQERGAIPGCEVARRGLAQTLVGNLHREESQTGRLVWNLPKPAGLVAIRRVRKRGSVLLPVQLCHQLILLPHGGLKVPAHSYQLVRDQDSKDGQLGGSTYWTSSIITYFLHPVTSSPCHQAPELGLQSPLRGL